MFSGCFQRTAEKDGILSSRTGYYAVRFYIPVAVLVLLVCVSVSALFSRTAKNMFISSIQRSVSSNLELSKRLYSEIWLTTIPVAFNLMSDPDILCYLYAASENMECILRALRILEQTAAVNYYIHSIYIYNEHIGFLSNFAGYEGHKPVSNPDIEGFILEERFPYVYYLRKSDFINNNGIGTRIDSENIYTLALPTGSAEGRRGYLVINMAESGVSPIIDTSPRWNKDSLFVVNIRDVHMPVVFSADPALFGVSASVDERLAAVVKEKKGEGIGQITDSGGSRYQAVWTDAAEIGLRFMYLIPETVLFEEIVHLQRLFAVIALAVCGIGLILSVLVSSQVRHRMAFELGLAGYLGGWKDIEFPFRFIKNFLYLGAVRLANGTMPASLKKIRRALAVKMDNAGTYAIISSIPVAGLCASLSQAIKGNISASYISVPVPAEEWPSAWELLNRELKCVYLCSQGCSDLRYPPKEKEDAIPLFPLDLFPFDDMRNAVRNGDITELGKIRDSIKASLLSLRSPDIFHYVVLHIARIAAEELSETVDIHLAGGINGYLDKLYRSETIEELSVLFDSLIQTAGIRVRFAEDDRWSKLISQCKLYIIDHITDRNLNTAVLADYLGFSLNYLRTLFKKRTGVSVNEYINLYRLELAKQMLTETDKTVYEICTETGFGTYSYFCTYFKKQEGISPSAYHRKMNIQNK